ncbi:TPA: pathogenicity island protein [Staphylococcus aureus]|nr:pathogenicity island protein [Staphylococcus aureus]HCD5540529.1 pathogenicity island protein [Staphylococcus aureus]HCX9184800.1 pathogenicity island protein [Staphylococcus aureus]HCX9620798.1 pathogenicity island protein [Staphylococcus aureus]HCY6170203.1 pathogenicity island protein [Staphylococcus aureus]
MKMYLTYICLVSLLAMLLLAISNMYVAFSIQGMLIILGFYLTEEITEIKNKKKVGS